MSDRNTCVRLGVPQCMACGVSQFLQCWVSFYEDVIESNSRSSSIGNAILFQITAHSAAKLPYRDWFRAAIKRKYPEHITTLDKMLILL